MVKSAGFRIASILIPTLLLVALGWVVYLVLRDNPDATPSPIVDSSATPVAVAGVDSTPQAQPPEIPEQFLTTATAPVALEGTLRYAEAGIAFGPPQGYLLDLAERAAILTEANGAPEGDSILVLRMESPDPYHNGDPAASDAQQFPPDDVAQLEAVFDGFVRFYAAQDGFLPGQTETLTIGGLPALAVDLVGDGAGDFGGRIALTQPTAQDLFVMIGVGPTQRWRTQGLADYMAVMETVTFLDLPGNVLPPETETEAEDESPPTPEPPTATATSPATPTLTPEPTATPEPEPDDNDTTVLEIPTPQPPSTPFPTPERVALDAAGWTIHTNGNFVNRIAAQGDTLWAATTGGLVAWNTQTGNHTKYTTADGLATNHFYTVVDCDLPDFAVVAGGDRGLAVYDPADSSWRSLSVESGDLTDNEVVDLYCDAEAGYLAVLYPRAGIDIFDAERGIWTHVTLDMDALEAQVGLLRRLTGVPQTNSLWIAAQRGLLQITGDLLASGQDEAEPVTLFVFATDNSPLQTDSVTTLVPAGSDGIWLAGNGAFYRTDGETWDVFSAESMADGQFPQGRINGLQVDNGGNVWVASDQTNICRFDPGENRCVEFYANESGMVDGPLSSFALDAQGQAYYGTVGNGLSTRAGDSWTPWVIEQELSMGNTVRTFTLDGGGQVWIGANGGATRVDPQNLAQPVHYTPGNSQLPFADIAAIGPSAQDDGVWVGANGAARFNGTAWTGYTAQQNLVDAPIQAITADGAGRTWLGSNGAGISIWTGSNFFNLTAANGLTSEEITTLVATENAVWIGTRGGGLMRFQNNQLRFYSARENGLPSNTITALAVDTQGTLGPADTPAQAPGALLVGTDRGLAYLTGETGYIVETLPPGPLTALAVPPSAGGDGTVYWAVQESAILYRLENGVAVQIDPPALWPDSPINAVLLDSTGRLWVGFQRGGLALYSP